MQVRAADRDEVSAPGKQDGIGVVVGGNGADCDGGDTDVRADALGEGGLIAAAVLGALLGHDLTAGDVDGVDTVFDERPRDCDGVVDGGAVWVPVDGGDTHQERLALRPGRPYLIKDLQRESEAVMQASAEVVGAMVRQRRQEGREQESVTGLDFENIESGGVGSPSGPGEVFGDASSSEASSSRGAGRSPNASADGPTVSQPFHRGRCRGIRRWGQWSHPCVRNG